MKNSARMTPGLIALILLGLLLLNGTAVVWLGWPNFQRSVSPLASGETMPTSAGTATAGPSEPTPTQTLTLTSSAPTQTAVPLSIGNPQAVANLQEQGVLLLSMRDGEQVHLFAYHPDLLPLTRLTNQPWDETGLAISPDGTRLAYASRQNGYWDLYLRNLSDGGITRLTDTPEYEGAPSWSPDGQWLAYEAYREGTLDIYLQSLADLSQPPIRLTDDPTADSSPAWSPGGRQIAFVSLRSGEAEIWLADLDRIDDRFINLSQSIEASEDHPVWSPDGSRLAWASEQNGEHRLVVWDVLTPSTSAGAAAAGDWPAWSPAGDLLFAAQREPNQTLLVVQALATGRQRMVPAELYGEVYGIQWKDGPLDGWLLSAIDAADQTTPPTLVTQVQPPEGQASIRPGMAALSEISAPVPMLHQDVVTAFLALRQAAATQSGWDVLSSLENAYVPITAPPTPSMTDDWLYTGRAFAINPLILSAGWITTAREDFNGQTYWRIYLKARFQDGSAGTPITRPVWDLNARFTGDPSSYEQGGKPAPAPEGYWIDLTELAQRYGWERLPSRPNWRAFFPGIRFNQFAIRGGLDWKRAMAEIYPPEALVTSTSMPTYTNTPTVTPTPSRTPRVTRPTNTLTPSITPTPTNTRRPTLTLPANPAP